MKLNHLIRSTAGGVLFAALALCHCTWVVPEQSLVVGKTSVIQIGHGHAFPRSEESIDAKQAELYVLTPSGARVDLKPAAVPGGVSAPFDVKQPGAHRIVMIQDRGVTSRTPAGVKPGGRDKNPDAATAARTFRTAVAHASTGAPGGDASKPLGLEVEMAATRTGDGWTIQVLKKGQPAAGVSVEAFAAGGAKAVELGKTGADGKVRYAAPTGRVMFSAGFKDPMPAGSSYDTTNYETSLVVN